MCNAQKEFEIELVLDFICLKGGFPKQNAGFILFSSITLVFQAGTVKMGHSPKVKNGVDNCFFFFCDQYFQAIFSEEL